MIENFKHRCNGYAIPKYLINRTATSQKQLQKLAENAAYSNHGGCLSEQYSGLLRTHFTLHEAPPASRLNNIKRLIWTTVTHWMR